MSRQTPCHRPSIWNLDPISRHCIRIAGHLTLLAGLAIGVSACAEPNTQDSGCITINGEGGYQILGEAVAAANPGDTVTLCARQYAAGLVIAKDLTIEGPGPEALLFNPPEGEPKNTLTIGNGAIVHLRNLAIGSTTSGVQVEGAEVNLQDVTFLPVSEFGIFGTDATVTLTDCTFESSRAAAIDLTNTELTVSNVNITDAQDYGIRNEGGTVSVAATTITGVRRSGTVPADDHSGTAIDVRDLSSPAIIDNVTISDVDFATVWSIDASLDVSNSFLGPASQGIIATAIQAGAAQSVTVTNTSISDIGD